MAWTLLRDARALQNADQLRRAVIDAATAAELAATKRIDDLLAKETDPHRRQTLSEAKTLGGKARALRDVGDELPENFKTDLVDKRNDAVHEGREVRYPNGKLRSAQRWHLSNACFRYRQRPAPENR
jgi:hypothetical protein